DLADAPRISALRDRFAASVGARLPDALILGHRAPRLCNTLAFQLPGVKAETAQIAFDLSGVSVSAGAACSSGKTGRSHVTDAMGLDGELGAVRVSIGPSTGEAELAAFDAALAGLAARRRAA
ncbi:MAG: cysteine desulfurase, partial [Rhizobiaceae bacterium]